MARPRLLCGGAMALSVAGPTATIRLTDLQPDSVVVFTPAPTSTGTLLRMSRPDFGQNSAGHGGAKAGWEEHLASLEKVVTGGLT